MNTVLRSCIFFGFAVCALTTSSAAPAAQREELKVVIIRHGEKADDGDNLNCQGENRALRLPKVLFAKFGKPDFTYVSALGLGTRTKHARMFQTVTPMAVKFNLEVNTHFDRDAVKKLAEDIKRRSGTVLVVWEHRMIRALVKELGVPNPPKWRDGNFDGIWIVRMGSRGVTLAFDHEDIHPSSQCDF